MEINEHGLDFMIESPKDLGIGADHVQETWESWRNIFNTAQMLRQKALESSNDSWAVKFRTEFPNIHSKEQIAMDILYEYKTKDPSLIRDYTDGVEAAIRKAFNEPEFDSFSLTLAVQTHAQNLKIMYEQAKAFLEPEFYPYH